MVLLARKDGEGNTQTLYDHLHGAGRLASGFEDEFADISRTAAVLHDVGKVAQQFQTYLWRILVVVATPEGLIGFVAVVLRLACGFE